jgi:hypothetical protein
MANEAQEIAKVAIRGQHGRIAADDWGFMVHDFIGQWAAKARHR